ncbi:MAG: hypothetical protein E7E42_00625 [Veillonella sp.]|nr:hypothetical protein [Veillonella sp.]
MATQIELTENSPPIQHLYKKDKRLAKVISMVGPIRYTVHEDGFDFLVHEIIEQMLSIRTTRKTGGLLTGYKPVVLGQRLKALAFTTFKTHSH